MSKREYYVIVNLSTLEYQESGNGTDYKHADKFDTVEEAKQELNTYDKECYEFAIYKATEYVEVDFNKVKEESNE